MRRPIDVNGVDMILNINAHYGFVAVQWYIMNNPFVNNSRTQTFKLLFAWCVVHWIPRNSFFFFCCVSQNASSQFTRFVFFFIQQVFVNFAFFSLCRLPLSWYRSFSIHSLQYLDRCWAIIDICARSKWVDEYKNKKQRRKNKKTKTTTNREEREKKN